LPVGTEETHELTSQASRCPDWDPNRAPLEYKSGGLFPDQPVQSVQHNIKK
jgi:hypothetical protein